jgi:hypothetical protein
MYTNWMFCYGNLQTQSKNDYYIFFTQTIDNNDCYSRIITLIILIKYNQNIYYFTHCCSNGWLYDDDGIRVVVQECCITIILRSYYFTEIGVNYIYDC